MMDQHPIPQQITSYEFKLVGDMTLKQFLKAAGGVLLAVLINSSSLVFFIKYPLIFIFGAGGLALAFVPYQDRPLETWLLAFIRSIYAPTIYTYRKAKKVNWLEIDPNKKLENEEDEKKRLRIPVKNDEKVKEFIQSLPSVKREEERTESKENENINLHLPEKQNQEVDEEADKTKEIKEERKEETFEIEETEKDWRDQKSNLGLKTERLEATGKAVFGKIPMPDIPELPNLIVGMVTDPDGKIIEGAIVEIQDEVGNPSRVLKSNSLGQFRTSTQLANGRYLIITEKEGYSFDRVNVDLGGTIVQPVRVISKMTA